MPGRVHLSEEEQAAERDGRERLHSIDQKLRDLYARRSAQLTQVHHFSDEQRALADRRAPQQAAVETAHRQHQEIGHGILENRRHREAARKAADEALADLREARSTGPRGERPRPELLKREMAELELRQQTRAQSLADENALIARLRELQKQLSSLEKETALRQAHEAKVTALEEAVKSRRADFERLRDEGEKLRRERERVMGSVRQQLVDTGTIYAELRAKAKLRREAMERVELLSKEIYLLESEGNRLLRESKERRFEAQRSVKEYNRSVREAVGGHDRLSRTADAQFEELLKRGRITLGGGSGT